MNESHGLATAISRALIMAAVLATAACSSAHPFAKSSAKRMILQGHENHVFGVAFHPDDSVIYTAGWDGRLACWDPQGLLLSATRGSGEPRLALAVNPDSGIVASAFFQRGVIEIHDEDGDLVRHFPAGDQKVNSLAFDDDGDRLLAGLENGEIRTWKKNGKAIMTGRFHSRPVAAVAWHPDGDILFSAERGPIFAAWEDDGTKPVKTVDLSPETIYSMTVFPRGHMIALGTKSGAVVLLDDDYKEFGRLQSESAVWCMASAREGDYLFTGHQDGTIRIWDMDKKRQVHSIQAHEAGVLSLSVDATGERIISSGQDGKVHIIQKG